MNQYEKTVQEISDFFVIGKEHVISMFKGWLDLGYSLLVAEMVATDILSRSSKKERSNLTNEEELLFCSKFNKLKYTTNIWIEIFHESLEKYPDKKVGFFLNGDDIDIRHPNEDEIGLSLKLLALLSGSHLLFLRDRMLVSHQKMKCYDLFRRIINKYVSKTLKKNESTLAEHFFRLIVLNGFPSEINELKSNLNKLPSLGSTFILMWTASMFEIFICASDVLNAMMKYYPNYFIRFLWSYKFDKSYRKSVNIATAFIFVLLLFVSRNSILGMIGYHNIKYNDVKVTSNSGIGNDWSFQVMINEQRLIKGGTKYLGKSDFPVEINVTATEIDKYNDVGTASVVINSIYKSYKEVIPVIVRETKGPGAGGKATVEFSILIH